MLYSLTMYIFRFYADAMDVTRYQVASGVDMACVYSPTHRTCNSLGCDITKQL